MPWTKKQTGYLLSDASPLADSQKQKMLAELEADPSLATAKKKKKPMAPAKPAVEATPKKPSDSEGYTYNWKQHQGQQPSSHY